MSYEIKDMTGSLFENEEKKTDRSPDFTGNIKINGKVWRIAGWNTEARSGREYISIAVSDPAEFNQQNNQQSERRSSAGQSTHYSDMQRRVKQKAADFKKRQSNDRDDIPDDDDVPF